MAIKKPDLFYYSFPTILMMKIRVVALWTPLYHHTKFQSRAAFNLAVTNFRSRSYVWALAFAFTASTDSNLVSLSTNFTFRKRKNLHDDVPSLECCFLPNNTSQRVVGWHVVLMKDPWGNLPEVRSHSSHMYIEGIQNIFIIKLIYNLTFRHPINVGNPPDIKKNHNCFNFRLAYALSSS